MTTTNQETQESLDSRFEFRVFGDDLQSLRDLFSHGKMIKKESISDEIYLILQISSNFNIKIRDNTLEIKKLIAKSDFLEQWEPLCKLSFPINMQTYKELFTLLQIKLPIINQNRYTKEQFLSVIQSCHYIDRIKVHKQRTQYIVDDIIIETADVEIEGINLQTICFESTNKEKLHKLLCELHLSKMQNTNYLEEIKLLKQHLSQK